MSVVSDPRWSEALAHLPDYLGNHVRVSVTALALGLLISLPLAIMARDRPVMRGTLLGLASIVQTVPGLALLALFYPLLPALAALSLSWFGFRFSAFGFLPAVLALLVDQLLALIESGLRNRSRLRAALGGVGIAALVGATLVPTMMRAQTNYIVGAKTFTEQYVLSALMAQRLKAASLPATTREGLGSNVNFEALAFDDIDVYNDYSGTLWLNQFHHSDIRPRDELLGDLKTTLAKQNITLLGELGFENAYALVMPRKRAEQLGIRTIADLASRAANMSIAGDYEFFSRPEWTALRKAYGLSFRGQRQMQPDFMYAAVASGEVDVIAGYTSDGLIAKYDLVALGDIRRAIPPYDAVVLLAPKRANDEGLRKALAPLLGKIDIATMREANLHAAGNDAASSPDAVAQWLWEKVGKK